jgi:hypothetical protein
MATRLAAFAEL